MVSAVVQSRGVLLGFVNLYTNDPTYLKLDVKS